MAKIATSFRLSGEALQLLKKLQAALGLSQSGILELAIRELERRQCLK